MTEEIIKKTPAVQQMYKACISVYDLHHWYGQKLKQFGRGTFVWKNTVCVPLHYASLQGDTSPHGDNKLLSL